MMTQQEYDAFLENNYNKLSTRQWLTVSWWSYFNDKKARKFVNQIEYHKDIIKAFYNTKYG